MNKTGFVIKERVARVRCLFDEAGLDALLISHLPSLRYLCGFTGSSGLLLLSRDRVGFLTDSRYTIQSGYEVVADEILEYKEQGEAVGRWLEKNGCRRIGYEAEAMTVATLERLQKKVLSGVEWVPLAKEMAPLRSLKDSDEVAMIEEAAKICAEAFDEVAAQIRPGAVERDVALALEFAIKRRGGEEKAFDFIVASGERGAMPHGVASDRTITSGDLVTIDFGTRLCGYHSDETVTIAVGEPAAELRVVYETVLAGHDLAIDAVRPGISLKEIDAVARDYIGKAGYGDYFGHGLGHGVGLEVHEFPTLSPRSDGVAAEGMVFTVEPGIYIPGLGGVRIEDTVVVTEDGCRKLTRIPKTLRVLPD